MSFYYKGESVSAGGASSAELEVVQELLKTVNGDTTTTPPVEGLTDKVTAAETDIANIQTALVGTTEQPGIDSRLQTLENTAITDVVSDGNSILTTVTNKTATVALSDTIGVDTVELGVDDGTGYRVGSSLSAIAPNNERGLYVQTEVTPDSGTLIGKDGITMIVGLGEDATLPIRRVAYPTEDTDAANKQYVDEAVATAGGGITPTGETAINNPTLIAGDTSSANLKIRVNSGAGSQAINVNANGEIASIIESTSPVGTTETRNTLSLTSSTAPTYNTKPLAFQEAVTAVQTTANNAATVANAALPKSGGTMNGQLIIRGVEVPLQFQGGYGQAGLLSLDYVWLNSGIGMVQFRPNVEHSNRSVRLTGLSNPINGVDAANKAYVDAVLPSGAIIMFNGEIDPPAGWMVCDGSNGTPNIMASWPTDFGGVPVVWLQKW